MANLITLSRLILLILVVIIAYLGGPIWQLVNVLLLIAVFVTDGFDGYVARKRGETSVFGAMFDILGDRIVELTLWIVLSDLTFFLSDVPMVAIWVPITFVIRGVIVDTIRAHQVADSGAAPFELIKSAAGRWIVSGKFMRIFYAVLKAITFSWLLFIRGLEPLLPELWANWSWLLLAIAQYLIVASVVICIARALPVIIEFLYEQRDSWLPSTGRSRQPSEVGE